jgi:FtsZ-binding cell division protein ZapB
MRLNSLLSQIDDLKAEKKRIETQVQNQARQIEDLTSSENKLKNELAFVSSMNGI